MPKFERKGLMIRFEKAPGQWGEWIVIPTGGGGGRDDKLFDLQKQLSEVGNLVKTQDSNANKVIGTDGTNLLWTTAGGSPFTSPVAINVDSASSALAINQIGAGNALLVEDSANPDSTPTVIDASGNLILGKTSRHSVISNKFEVHSTSSESSGLAPAVGLYNWSTSTSSAPNLSFFHYPSGTVGTTAANASGDVLGRVRFYTTSGGFSYVGGISATTASDLVSVNMFYTGNSHTFNGPITSGTWNGTAIGIAYGGTGQTTAVAAFDALSPTTTKGDLIVNNGTDNVRVPVGTDGQVLTADSAAASGVAWATGGGGGGISSADIQEFTSTGTSTWTKPAGAKLVYVLMFGGGAGGGSGRRRALASSTAAGGGGGAGAGGRSELWIPAAALGGTETVTVGAGGTGGAARTTDDTSGASGGDGTSTSFGSWGLARPGAGGGAGSTSAGSGNNGGGGGPDGISNSSTIYGAAGGNGSTTTPSASSRGGYRGGGGAGGAGFAAGSTTSNAGAAGGLGGAAYDASTSTTGGGGTAGATNGAGGNGANATSYFVGGSGGGGGGSGTTTAGAGGNGGYPGGGGAGGGAGHGVNSGAGGNGGNGYVRVITFF
jgi:hypothetical protein